MPASPVAQAPAAVSPALSGSNGRGKGASRWLVQAKNTRGGGLQIKDLSKWGRSKCVRSLSRYWSGLDTLELSLMEG